MTLNLLTFILLPLVLIGGGIFFSVNGKKSQCFAYYSRWYFLGLLPGFMLFWSDFLSFKFLSIFLLLHYWYQKMKFHKIVYLVFLLTFPLACYWYWPEEISQRTFVTIIFFALAMLFSFGDITQHFIELDGKKIILINLYYFFLLIILVQTVHEVGL